MNQLSAFRLILIFAISFFIYYFLSYRQSQEREGRFQAIERSIQKIQQDIKELRQDLKDR